ncbi:MAG: single-stranded-DNA-specific exonuclease RecJ [Candidatus Magasanikbacteria bacterium]
MLLRLCKKKWEVLTDAPLSFFEEHPELPKTVANLLYHRDIRTQKQIDEFLNPDYSQDIHDPFLFRDMEKTVNRLLDAIEKNEKIIIHGDYDADGVSGCTVLATLFEALHFTNFDVFLPHRETDGYGLNEKNIQTFIDEKANILITCDCGISNFAEIEKANEGGIDVIITDHHSIPETVPNAFAIIHPKIEGETYPDKGLAGGAVAFKLAQGILKKHKENNVALPNGAAHDVHEKWLLDMVAISSVADMVPLIGESRTLTKYGLIVLNKTKRIGLQKMFLEIGIKEEDGSMKREIDADTIGFRIAPQINAAGRLNHANVAYKLMVTHDPIEATDLAFELNRENDERRKLTEQYVKKAIERIEAHQMNNPILFAFDKDWSPGLVGLVSSKLKEKYNKPCIVMTENDGQFMGSGRSVEGFNVIEAIGELSDLFEKFGGHPMAFGFTLKSTDLMEEFKEKLMAKYHEKTKGLDMSPKLAIDAKIHLDDITWELYDSLEKFAPFGQANPKPKYLAKHLTVRDIQPVGKDKTHLKIMIASDSGKIRKTIGWSLCNSGDPDWCRILKKGDTIDMVFEVGVNEWNGNRELQLLIVDLKKK